MFDCISLPVASMYQSVHYLHAHVELAHTFTHAYNCILASLFRLRNACSNSSRERGNKNTNVLRSAGLAANEQHKTQKQKVIVLLLLLLLVVCIWHVKRHRHAALLLLLLLCCCSFFLL